jgi:hypothetical protein
VILGYVVGDAINFKIAIFKKTSFFVANAILFNISVGVSDDWIVWLLKKSFISMYVYFETYI